MNNLLISLKRLFCKHPRWIELYRDYHDRCIKYRCLRCGKDFYEGI